jgi:predicted PurR-regulated permease PerM
MPFPGLVGIGEIFLGHFVELSGMDCYDRGMLGIDPKVARQAWTVIAVLLLAGLIIGAIYLIGQTLFIFIIALLFAYLLWPVVGFLDKRLPGRSKIPSLAIVYLALIAIIGVIGFAVGSRIVDQAYAFGAKKTELLSKLDQPIELVMRPGIGMKIVSEIQKQVTEHSRDLIVLLTNAIFSLMSHMEYVLFIILVPILSFFFLKDGRTILNSWLHTIPHGPNREIIEDITNDLHLLLVQYMRALFLIGLITATVYGIFLSAIGLPYGLLLGAIAFPFEFVPIVGPLTSSAIILIVAALSGYDHVLWIIIFLILFRLFQDYVLTPQLLSSGMEMHPLLVIFGVLAGGQLAGVAGTFLSVPVMATLRIVFRQLTKKRTAPGSADVLPAQRRE